LLIIERISKKHDRKKFDCGESALNKYLATIARQHHTKGISKTYVLLETDISETKIIGYYSLTICEIQTSNLPENIAKKYPQKIPGVKLGRLAIDKKYIGKGLGGFLLADAMKRVLNISDSIGVVAFFVDAKNANEKKFYKKFGFLQFKNNHLQLFLPLRHEVTK